MFGKETIELQLEAVDADSVLTKIANTLYTQGFVKESYVEAILQREANHPTGLPAPGFPIAIPHTDPDHVLESRIAVATLNQPVSFSMMGNPEVKLPVQIVFMLAIKDPKNQPSILKQLMKVFQNQEVLQEIRSSQGEEELQQLLLQHINISN